eukprot:5837675-Pyramimonas_sp.AAC.1
MESAVYRTLGTSYNLHRVGADIKRNHGEGRQLDCIVMVVFQLSLTVAPPSLDGVRPTHRMLHRISESIGLSSPGVDSRAAM